MRNQLTTILLLTTLAACDPLAKSIGSLDDDTGENTTDDGGICGPSLVDLEFEVSPEIAQDLTLTCAAEVSPTSDGYVVALTSCTDAQGLPADDVTVTLYGDWSEPLVDGEPQIELRYVWIGVVINEEVTFERWLSLRNPGGEHELALVAVDSTSTYPSAYGDFEFDYAPLAVDPVSTDCPLIENVACAPIQPGAMVVSVDDQPFEIAEGREREIGVDGDNYHVVVAEMHSLVDDCPGMRGDEYKFNIVAIPSN